LFRQKIFWSIKKQKNEKFKNKRVIILGGSSGLGLATAVAAAEEGAEIVIVSSNQSRIDSALKELPKGSLGFCG